MSVIHQRTPLLISRRQLLGAGAAWAALAYMPSAAWAQTGWSRAQVVKLIVPYAAGGATDVIARVLAAGLSTNLGQSVVVENRAGAGGSLGAGQVAAARKDGLTLLMGAFTSHTINQALAPHAVPFDVRTSFAPISMVGTVPLVFVVHPKLGVNTLSELVELARAKPQSLNFGSAGNGSPQHLAIEMFKRQAGVEVVHVPYRGSGPAMADLLAGQVHACIDTVPVARPHVAAGNLRALATTTAVRLDGWDAVPTVAEAGLPHMLLASSFALAAPAGISAETMETLHTALIRTLSLPEVQQALAAQGVQPEQTTPEEAQRRIVAEFERWQTLVAQAGIVVE